MTHTGGTNESIAVEVATAIKTKVKAPYAHARTSSLGGADRTTVLAVVSLDHPADWTNRIMENSRYARFHIDPATRTIELFSGYKTLKFRKAKWKTPEEVVTKIQRWVDSH